MKSSNNRTMLIVATLLFLSCLSLLGAAFLYSQKQSSTPPTSASSDVIPKVALLTDLPSGETPQVVSLTDLSAFKNQIFFSSARVGDILIVYVQNNVAILYDPKENKIVNMSRISVVIPSVDATS